MDTNATIDNLFELLQGTDGKQWDVFIDEVKYTLENNGADFLEVKNTGIHSKEGKLLIPFVNFSGTASFGAIDEDIAELPLTAFK